MLNTTRTALALLFSFAMLTSWAMAGTSGGMNGTVTDAKTGAPLPGVHVRISSSSQTVETTTDAHGHYSAFALQPDTYTLTAVKPGYEATSISGNDVEADQTQVYDIQLTPTPPSAPQSP